MSPHPPLLHVFSTNSLYALAQGALERALVERGSVQEALRVATKGADIPGQDLPGNRLGHALETIERDLVEAAPAAIAVYGEDEAALPAALAAAKLQIPVIQVVAGIRPSVRAGSSHEPCAPIHWTPLVDRLATCHLCPTRRGVQHLAEEGISDHAPWSGDVLVAALLDRTAGDPETRDEDFYFVRLEASYSQGDSARLGSVLDVLGHLDLPVVFWGESERSLALIRRARAVLTDSWALQREAVALGTPCLTLADDSAWPETIECGANRLVGYRASNLLEALRDLPRPSPVEMARFFRPEGAVERAADAIATFLANR